MTIVALIPLRGGSKSIPKKNIRSIAGKPLAAWVLDAAKNSLKIDTIFVSTDCHEVAEIVEGLGLGIEIIYRPPDLATDEASTESVMLHVMSRVTFDLLVTIQATSPLLTAKNLDEAITIFNDNNLDSMLSAVRTKRFFWSDDFKPMNYDPLCRPRRQNFTGTFMENGAFYVTKRNILERYQSRLGGNIGIYEMDEKSALEIDEPSDWDPIERLLLGRL